MMQQPRKAVCWVLFLLLITAVLVPSILQARQKGLDQQLVYAVLHGDKREAALLLASNANPNALDQGLRTRQDTYWHLLLQSIFVRSDIPDAGYTVLMLAVCRDQPDITRLLLNNRANVNAQECGGQTALDMAVTAGTIETIRMLIDFGAIVNTHDAKRRGPLHRASRRHDAAAARLLLECGAEPNTHDINGMTPLMLAIECRRPATVEALLAGGADANATDYMGTTPQALNEEYQDVFAATIRSSLRKYRVLRLRPRRTKPKRAW